MSDRLSEDQVRQLADKLGQQSESPYSKFLSDGFKGKHLRGEDN